MKAIVYQKQNLMTGGQYPAEFEQFKKDLQEQNVEIIELDQAIENDKLLQKIQQRHFETAEVLLIAATDAAIEQANAKNISVLAYRNPDYPKESLMGSPMMIESFDGISYDIVERVWRRSHKIPWEILTTSRCVVRELTLDDLDDLEVMYSQDGMTDYIEPLYERMKEEEYQRAYIENMYRFYGYGMWLVFHKKTGKLIGRAGIENRELNGDYEIELGYAISVPYQHQGYATEVCNAILAYAAEELDYSRVNCLIQEDNTASIELAVRLGFERVKDIVTDGQLYQRYIFNLKK